jgi:DNA-binding MarR family transcriptional regulator
MKRLGIASASVTALLDRLELAGLTRRERHPSDRRSVLVVLTPAGRVAIEGMFGLFSDDVYASVLRSEPAHVREFTAVLTKIAQALRDRAGQPAEIAAALTERAGSAEATRSDAPDAERSG